MKVIDYDKIEEWESELDTIISEIITQRFYNELQAARHEYIEDAGNMLSNFIGIENLINHLCERLSDFNVRFYHGTRLSDYEFLQINSNGLVPLDISKRKAALEEILKFHPEWEKARSNIDKSISYVANGGAGLREDGCIHACISRAGLLKGCNHYLEFGAEVDGHIVHNLFGPSHDFALALLKKHRKAALISFLYPFREAAEAANPRGIPKDSLSSLPGMLVSAWAYKKSNPSFKTASQRSSTAAKFSGVIHSSKIENVEMIQDEELNL